MTKEDYISELFRSPRFPPKSCYPLNVAKVLITRWPDGDLLSEAAVAIAVANAHTPSGKSHQGWIKKNELEKVMAHFRFKLFGLDFAPDWAGNAVDRALKKHYFDRDIYEWIRPTDLGIQVASHWYSIIRGKEVDHKVMQAALDRVPHDTFFRTIPDMSMPIELFIEHTAPQNSGMPNECPNPDMLPCGGADGSHPDVKGCNPNVTPSDSPPLPHMNDGVEGCNSNDAPSPIVKKDKKNMGGRPCLSDQVVNVRTVFLEKWKRAKDSKTQMKDFCNDNEITVRQLEIYVNWQSQRERRKRKTP